MCVRQKEAGAIVPEGHRATIFSQRPFSDSLRDSTATVDLALSSTLRSAFIMAGEPVESNWKL